MQLLLSNSRIQAPMQTQISSCWLTEDQVSTSGLFKPFLFAYAAPCLASRRRRSLTSLCLITAASIGEEACKFAVKVWNAQQAGAQAVRPPAVLTYQLLQPSAAMGTFNLQDSSGFCHQHVLLEGKFGSMHSNILLIKRNICCRSS